MALLISKLLFVSLTIFLILFKPGSIHSAPTKDVQNAPGASNQMSTLSSALLSKHERVDKIKSDESKDSSWKTSSRTLDSIMSMMNNFNIVTTMRTLFGMEGTKYEFVPLGSLIFSNRIGQGTYQ